MPTTDSYLQIEQNPYSTDNQFLGLVVADHTDAVKMLDENNLTPMSVQQFAEQRLVYGGYHQVSWTGSRTTDLLIVDGENMWLAHGDSKSDLWQPDIVDTYTRFHENNTELPVDEDGIIDKIRIPSTNFEIPVEDIVTHSVTRFLFKETVEEYQQWLIQLSIPYLPFMLPSVSLTKHHPYPFMRPLIMRCTDNWSGFITTNTDLHTPYGYRCYTDKWDKTILPPETFTTKKLQSFTSLLKLSDQPHTLSELIHAADMAGQTHLLGTVLRQLRNQSDLPANYDTWAPVTDNKITQP